MEQSCREEGELSEDENDDVITEPLEQVTKAPSKDEVIVIDDEDDKSSGINADSNPVTPKPLKTVNSYAKTSESRMSQVDKTEAHRKKHKKGADSKYHRTKRRGSPSVVQRSEKMKNNYYRRSKKPKVDSYQKTSHSNISGQSGFMDKMRGRYMYQGSGTLGDLLKERSSLKRTNNIREKRKSPSEGLYSDVKELQTQSGPENEVISMSHSSPENIRNLSRVKGNEVDSPVLDEDQEYAHLLLEYKEIKEKLVELQQEEKKLSDVKSGASAAVLEGAAFTPINDVCGQEDKTEVVDMELASSSEEGAQVSSILQKEPAEDEDDDIDLLELRLAALESAARAKKNAFEKESSDATISKENHVVKKSTAKTGKRRERSHQRSTSASRLLQLEEDRLHREKERLLREKQRIREMEEDLMYEREMIDRWREKHLKEVAWIDEIQRILSTKNKDLRYHRVLELFRLEDMAVRSPQPESKSNQTESLHGIKTQHNQERSASVIPRQTEQLEHTTRTESDASRHTAVVAEKGNMEGKSEQPTAVNVDACDNRDVVNQTASPQSSRCSEEEEEEEEEDILRARLLASVARRRRQRELERVEDVHTGAQQERLTDTLNTARGEQEWRNGLTHTESNGLGHTAEDEGRKECLDTVKQEQEQGEGYTDTETLVQEERNGYVDTVAQQSGEREQYTSILMQQQVQGQTSSLIVHEEEWKSDVQPVTEKPQQVQVSTVAQGPSVYSKPDTADPPLDMYRKSLQPSRSVLAIPKHEPVIIDLEEDSSEESDAEPPAKLSRIVGETQSGSFIGSLDSFLKAARKSVEKRSHQLSLGTLQGEPHTPDALKHLGSHKVQEYKMLKEEIRKRERKRAWRREPKQQTDLVVTVSDDLSRTDRQVVLQRREPEHSQSEKEVSSQDEGPSEAVEKGVLEVKPGQPDVGEVKARQLKQLSLKAALQRGLIDQEKQQIQRVRHLINKKKSVVKLAEQKIQKMKEQMMATQTVLKANLEQIAKLNNDAQNLQAKMDTRREKLLLLEKELQELGTSKQINNQREEVVNIGIDTVPVSTAGVDTGTSLQEVDANQLDEKMRLVQLERKYAALIKSYKESQALLEKEPVSGQVTTDSKTGKGHRRRSWGFGSRLGTPAKAKALEHVETEEKMAVSACEGEDPQDSLAVVRKKRRSSLYNATEDQVTQPQLDTEAKGMVRRVTSDATLVREGSSVSRESSPLTSTTQAFAPPTGQHLLNLKRLHMESVTNSSIFSSTSDSALQSETVISELKYQQRASNGSVLSIKEGNFRTYCSPLLKFKSYRLSPYFRTKSGLKLTNLTYSSQINPSQVLCRYDLTGKCNDDHCPWQHESDYRLEGEEILQDLVAYTPQLAGVSDQLPLGSYSQLIGKYAEQFSKQNHKMTLDQQCILLSSEVNSKGRQAVPHTLHLEARKWKPKATMMRHTEGDGDSPDCDMTSLECKQSKPQQKESRSRAEDDVLCEEDVRYWMLSVEEVQDMETAVLEDPSQIQVWIRLAYKKLHGGERGEDGVNQALNILSRALEANRESADLWLHYLSVYSQKQDLSDLYHLHKQAVLLAPCYQLYWKFLKLQPSYRKKIQLCSEIEAYLCKESVSDLNSHRVLEVTLYKVQLMVLTGRIKTAKHLFRDSLGAETVLGHLTQTDLVLAWLCYIHLCELHNLPSSLFNSSDSNPGKLVNKAPVIIDWLSVKSVKTSRYTILCSLVQDALSACGQTTGGEATGVQLRSQGLALLPLFQNAVDLHLAYNRNVEAREVCNELLRKYSSLPEVWILCHNVELKQGNSCKAVEVLEQSLRELPTEPQLQHTLAGCYRAIHNQDRALEVLELCPFHFFELPEEEESEVKDPNVLYSILLKLPTPLKCELPVKKTGLTEDKVKASLPYLWLNYCHLLELQGCGESEVIEAYETALSSLSNTKDVQLLWKSYLDYTLLQVQSSAKSCQSRLFKKFCELVDRCLVCVPLKVSLPGSQSHHYVDYGFHNSVIDMILGCVRSCQHGPIYEDFLRLMPTNVDLVIRACRHFYKEGEVARALGTCAVVFDQLSSSLPLCKMYVSLMYQTGNMKEVQRLYRFATKKLPYCIWLWKNYLLFEATWGKGEQVRLLLQQCRDLEVNIDEFRSTVLRC